MKDAPVGASFFRCMMYSIILPLDPHGYRIRSAGWQPECRLLFPAYGLISQLLQFMQMIEDHLANLRDPLPIIIR